MYFYTKGMIPTIAKRWINSVDVKVFFKGEKGKIELEPFHMKDS